MRARTDFRYQSQGDARGLCNSSFSSYTPPGFLNQPDLVNGIYVDGVNSSADRVVKLARALARAVKNNLIGLKTDSQCFKKLATAVDLNVDARIQHGLQNSHIRICLRCIKETDRMIH